MLVRSGAAGTVWTAGGDGSAREWNGTTGALVREIKGVPADVRALSVSGSRVAVGCASGSVLIWNGEGDQPKASLKAPSAVVDVCLPAEGGGEKIAVAGADNTARVFDWSGKLVSSVKGDFSALREAEAAQRSLEIEETVFAATKESLAEAQKNETSAKDRVKKSTEALPVKVKEIEPKKKALEEAQAARETAAKKAAEAEAGLKAAAEGLQKAEAAQKEAEEAKKQDAELANAVKASKTAHAAAETAHKTATEALDAADKKRVAAEGELERAEKARMLAEAEIPLAQAEEKNATAAVVKSKEEVTAQEAVRARVLAERDALRKRADAAVAVNSVRLVSEEGTLLVGLSNGLVQVCAAQSGAVLGVFGERREKGGVVHMGMRAQRVAAVGADGVVWGWDTRTKWAQSSVLGNPKTAVPLRDRVLALAFNADGSLLAASSGEPSREGDLFLWETRDWSKEPRRMTGAHSDTILAMAFSPDGKSMVTGGADKVARIIDLETLKVKMTLEGHTHHVLGVDWSPDGRTIVTGGADNMVKIWDALSGARKKNVDGVDKEVTAVRFIGSGAQFAAASGDGKVRVVAVNGTPARTITAATTFVNAIHAPLVGSSLASGGNDGVLRLWNVTDGSKISELVEMP
jgi:WD40 repeat protein